MANQLWIYTTPSNASVQLIADNGVSVMGIPTVHENRTDAQLIEIPFNTAGIGCLLKITSDGYIPFEGRALLVADDDEAFINMDDFHLSLSSTTSPNPEPISPPSYSGSPEEIINQVYQKTNADLSSHDGCGKFTEDVCTALHDTNSAQWGHIKKNPGQNQYNGHAIDAVYLLSGTGFGVYDIIHDSVSPNASPSFNWKDGGDPSLWYYPAASNDSVSDTSSISEKSASKKKTKK